MSILCVTKGENCARIVLNNVKFRTVNVNSLFNKVVQVSMMMRASILDVLAFRKTWQVPVVATSFVDVPGYAVICSDTDRSIRKPGDFLYVADRLKFLDVDNDCPSACAAHLVDLDVRVISVYYPPSNTAMQDDVLVKYVVTGGLTTECSRIG